MEVSYSRRALGYNTFPVPGHFVCFLAQCLVNASVSYPYCHGWNGFTTLKLLTVVTESPQICESNKSLPLEVASLRYLFPTM